MSIAARRTRAGPTNSAACQLPPPNTRCRQGGVARPTTDPGAAVALSYVPLLRVRELRLGLILEVGQCRVDVAGVPDDPLQHRRPLRPERARQQVRAVERERLRVAHLLGLL